MMVGNQGPSSQETVRTLRPTPARIRWLQDLDMGLVTVHTCHTIVMADWAGNIKSITDEWHPRHPAGVQPVKWLSSVQQLWTVSRCGNRHRRIAKLTLEGRRWLKKARV